ncbi:MAG: Hsp70 family protein, partial [Candidatus Nealsonbacteria bacterium]|nr:Hsp70 family protein [Candidatus Nealsonbacteria bacterium]
SVSAKDKATNKSQSIRIEGSLGISQDEVDRMKKDAEMHAEEDKKKKELIDAKNIADNLIFTWEKTEKESGNKINPDLKKEINEKAEALKKAKDGDNMEEIKAKSSEFSAIIQKAGSELYKQAQEKPKEEKKEGGNDAEEGKYKEK